METPLDHAHANMEASPQDEVLRLRFYERLADAELFLILEEEVSGDIARPSIFETADGNFALVFDREDRLAEFADAPTPFVAMSGRRITKLLASEGVGIGLNLGVAPSSTLLPAAVIDWLQETLGAKTTLTTAMPEQYFAPYGLPESLIMALDTKLANMSGVVAAAHLVGVKYTDGQMGHMLALLDVSVAAREGVAEAISEALQFSGIDAGQLDVAFPERGNANIEQLTKLGLGFEIPALILPEPLQTIAPGMDPDKPPKLG